MAKENIIFAHDCRPFFPADSCKKDFDWKQHLQSFSETFISEGNSVFHLLSNARNKEDDMPFAQYLREWDEKNKKWVWKWCAGRWVGNITVVDKPNTAYQIKVAPRFGFLSLIKMIEEIFSINILNSFNQEDFKGNPDNLFRQLLPFIWAQRLGEANKYGIPHHTVDVLHKGLNVKGRLLVRNSMIPFFMRQGVVSATREKQVDSTICRIILQAYRLMNKPIVIDNNKKIAKNLLARMSENAKNAIVNFENARISDARITPKEYESIQYKSIYESWRDIVDFSWQIIQHYHFSQRELESKKSFGAFVDMAEIWEMFLRSILRKAFPDWTVSSPEIDTYNGTFFKRKIIPDIVMQRGEEVMVFDAKWKRMNLEQYDVDRSDFFQIHAYIQYYKESGFNVIAGGLLYPFSANDLEGCSVDSLYGISRNKTAFIIDGICLGKESGMQRDDNTEISDNHLDEWKAHFEENIDAFIGRIKGFVRR